MLSTIISEITLMKWLAFITVKISRKLNMSEKILPKLMVLTYQCESNGEMQKIKHYAFGNVQFQSFPLE